MQKYLTFDCYGTLLNESKTYDELAEVAKKIGVDSKLAQEKFHTYQADRSNMHPYVDYDLLTRNNLINLDYKFGLKHQFEKYYVDILEAHRSLVPFPETITTLKKFIAAGYKLIMMSNSSWSIITKNVEALQVPFDVWTAEDVHAYKPDLKFFKIIEKEYGLNNKNHIHIAEGYGADIVPCKQLNWNSIWVNRNYERAEKTKPTYEVHKLDEIPDILKANF